MKTLIISCALVLTASVAFAQAASDTIVVAPGQSGLYFYHIVQKGESMASLSRQYGLQQDALSRLNNTQSLEPYEMIKIPLASSQIVQNGTAADNNSLKPLYHKVLKGETLFRVGKLYGDIPLDQLRQWNNLQGNNVGVGQYLIIGWLKKPSPQTNIAQHTPAPAPAQNTPTTDSPAAKSQPEGQATQPVTETASSSEGHAFLQEVIASEKHHARNKGSLATETAVSRPLLSGAPESPGPSSSSNRTESAQAVSRPLLSAAPAVSTQNRSQPASPAPTSSSASHTPLPASTPDIRPQQQASVPESASKPAAPGAPTETKKTATDQDGPAAHGGQEAKDKNPFEKMLNQITGKKEKASTPAATSTPSSRPAEQTTAPQTGQPVESAATNPSQAVPPVQDQQVTTTPAETPTAIATLPAANTPSTVLTPGKASAGGTAPDSSVLLSTGVSADSAALHLAQKSEFQELYLAQTQDEKLVTSKKGAAGWFKSNVKPGSKKYYALCNDLPRGTIVKVINPINKQFVYVKVLSSIPEQKENYNLIIKLSDAAMEDLGTHQPRFWSQIVYPRLKD